jgi:uncharacterized LabA/DUF88 family protein
MDDKFKNYAFIDGNNLNLGMKGLGWKLDYARFRRYLKEKYKVKTAYIFLGYVASFQPLYSSLQKYGYVLIFKPTIPDGDGNVKGNIDANLVLQAMIDFAKYDKALIVTSDGDFYCLVDHLIENQKLEKVISSHIKNCSSLLRKSAKGKIVFMDSLRKKLEFKRKNAA